MFGTPATLAPVFGRRQRRHFRRASEIPRQQTERMGAPMDRAATPCKCQHSDHDHDAGEEGQGKENAQRSAKSAHSESLPFGRERQVASFVRPHPLSLPTKKTEAQFGRGRHSDLTGTSVTERNLAKGHHLSATTSSDAGLTDCPAFAHQVYGIRARPKHAVPRASA